MQLSESKKEKLLKRLRDEPVFFIEKSFHIIDKQTNRFIRFKLNKIQHFFYTERDKFNFIIKSRKGGISTLVIALFLHRCAFYNNERAVLLCQNEDATKKMLKERVIPLIENSEFKFNVNINKSEGLIEFLDTKSTYYIGTAGSKSFGRGSDITMFHASEFAHWDNPDVLTGIEEALMDNAWGVIETTANGINFAHKSWKNAVNKQSRYKAIFIPWFFDETYQLSYVTALPSYTPEERKLIEAFDLTPAQIAWRRKKIKDMSMPEYFPQEYPATAEEAFVSKKTMVFDWLTLVNHEKLTQQPKYRGWIREMFDKYIFTPAEPNRKANLSVWRIPQNDHRYIIGADIAEGIEDGAYSAAFVLDTFDCEQVAEWHGHIPPDEFGEVLYNLGAYYNWALICPEAWPGPGGTTMVKLVDLNYPNLYKRQKSKYSNKTDEQLWGWETTKKTKPLMIYNLSEGLKKFEIKIKSFGLIDEFKSFVYDGEKMVPQEGCFSDRVIACGIAFKIYKELDYEEAENPITFKDKYLHKRRNYNKPQWYGKKYGVRQVYKET